METRIERVVLETDRHRIVGDLTLPREGYRSRLSDYLNGGDVDFIPLVQAELTPLLGHQKMAFNSPVWFNVGIEPKPQCSACFINSVQDTMDSILTLART